MKKHASLKNSLLRIMKITGFHLFLILTTLQVLHSNHSIAQAILDQTVTISVENQPLEKILYRLEDQMNVHFTYSIQRVNIHQKMSLNVQEKPFEQLMDQIVRKLKIEYTVYNNRNIVLSRSRVKKLEKGISLSGTILSDESEPIQFANVILTPLDSKKSVLGDVTNELGVFSFSDIASGRYTLTVSFLGYEDYNQGLDIFESLSLGELILYQSNNILEEVSLTARRKIFKQEIDRLILDVGNSLLSNKGTALDVLSSTPGINVKNDQISMIGKSTIGVLVNDKLIRLPQEELASFLRSISSQDILRVEVITTPPAKYAAEGNSGLVNIILKKAKTDSWNTQINTGFLSRTEASYNGGARFNFNKNKLSLVASIFASDGIYHQEQDDYAHFADGLWYTLSPLRSDYQRLNGRIDLNYQIANKWSVGAQYIRNQTNYLITDAPYTPVFDYETGEILRYLQSTKSEMNWKPVFNSLNANSSFDLDTMGKKLQVNLDYFNYENQDNRVYQGVSVINAPVSTQYYAGVNENLQTVENLSGSIDLEVPTKWASIEFGGKMTRSISRNNISFFNSGLVDEEVSTMPLEDNDFKYTENIQALYVSLQRKLGEKTNIQLGLRAENTQTNAQSNNLELNQSSDYIRFFPTAYLAYKATISSTWGLSYSRRISRPRFGHLNPNVFFINPFQIIVGNAFLQPSYTDNFEASFTKGNFTAKTYFSREQDIFAQVPLPDQSTNNIVFTNENYVNTKRYGGSIFHVYEPTKWWKTSNSLNLNYSSSTFELEEAHEELEGINGQFSTSNDFLIPRLKGLSLNAGFDYALPGTNYIFKTRRTFNLNASVQFKLLNDKLKLSLSANDLTRDSAEQLEATVNGVLQTARYYYDSQSIYFSASYTFGNENIRTKRHKSGNQEERRRTGI